MSSTLSAPPVIDSALPATPAAEWANSTKTAILEESSSQGTVGSTVSTATTPGPDFPGAFPKENEPTTTTGLTSSLPDPMSMLETAKQYLPQSVASYFPGSNTTLSSTSPAVETPQSADSTATLTMPRPIGGDRSTTSFTEPESVAAASTRAQAGSSVGGGSTTDSTPLMTPLVDQESGAHSGMVGASSRGVVTDSREHAHLSSHGDQETVPPDVPNTIGEPTNDFKRGDTPSREHDHLWTNGEDTSAPKVPSKTEDAINEFNGLKIGPSDLPSTEPAHSESRTSKTEDAIGHSNDLKTGPSDLPSPETAHGEPKTSISKFQESTGTTPASSPISATNTNSASATSTGTENSSQESVPASPRGSRFRDKIRGEVKILSGKLGKNEEKIEEGRRLMGKV